MTAARTPLQSACAAAIDSIKALADSPVAGMTGLYIQREPEAIKALGEATSQIAPAFDNLFATIASEADVSGDYDNGLIIDQINDGLAPALRRAAEELYEDQNLSPREQRYRRVLSKQVLDFSSPGRMISGKKRCPDGHVCVFNANVCLKSKGKIWFGDLDLTLDADELLRLAAELREDVYVLREMDARFTTESSPRYENAVACYSPPRDEFRRNG
jgi:hypothetical protein